MESIQATALALLSENRVNSFEDLEHRMSTATDPETMTAKEFIRKYGGSYGVELVRGKLVRLPMPGANHGEIGVNATFLLKFHIRQVKCGRVVGLDTFVRTRPDGYRGADVAYISYKRLPKSTPMPKGPLEVMPELVVEVRSPHDRSKAIRVKTQEYLDAGVNVVVIIDPKLETVTAFRTNELPQRFHNGDIVTIPDVLPRFSVPVKEFFE